METLTKCDPTGYVPRETRRTRQTGHYRSTMTKLACGVYALLVSVAGLVFPIAEALTSKEKEFQFYSEILSIYTYFVSLMFLAYLHFFLLRTAPSAAELYYTSPQELAVVQPPSVQVNNDLYLQADNDPAEGENRVSMVSSINEVLTLEKGKDPTGLQFTRRLVSSTHAEVVYEAEGTNFYLRLGAIAFGLGTMILNGFKISEYFGAVGEEFCESPLYIAVNVLQLLFTFIQTFFLFKSHKVIINKHKAFVRFGLMHLVATNICVWLNVLVKEAKEDFLHVDFQTNNGSNSKDNLNNTCYAIKSIGDEAAPYLFPFPIEYSLIGASVIYSIYCNVGRKLTESATQSTLPRGFQAPSRLDSVSVATHGTNVADPNVVNCHKANRGLFLGLFMLMLTLVSMCLFFVFVEKMENRETSLMIFLASELFLMLIGLLTVLFAMCRLSKLKFSETEEGFFDDTLLVISLTGVYAYEIFVIIASVKNFEEHDLHAYLMLSRSVLCVIQATLQTIFILDGLRRCAESDDHIISKPGRCLVTFLLVCNMSIWLISSFEVKKIDVSQMLNSFYSHLPWTIISHFFIPLIIFFRFHSTVCLAHIWQHAYIKKEKDV